MASQAPFGDIFLVNTPSLDRVSQQLYAEQRQRQATQEKNAQMADQELQKEIGKIRSADTPEVINAYNNYKKLSQQALFDKSLSSNTQKRNQILQAAQLAKADLMQKAQQSQELLAQGKQLAMEHMKSPDQFADNFGDLISAYNKTPMSQLGKHKLGDLTNLDTYAYKGTNTDFGKLAASAAGQPKQVYAEEVPVDKTGLQTKITPYLYGNNPLQFRDQYLGALAQRRAGRDASIIWKSIPQQEKDTVNEAYAAIPPERLKKMGLPELPDLPTDTGNEALDMANFQAKKYALANEPKQGIPQFRTNEAKKFQMETDRQMRMKAIEKANTKELIDYRKSINPNDKELNDLWVDKYIQTIKEDAKDTKPVEYKYAGGKKIYEHDVPLDPTLASSLQKSGVTPTYLRITSDGKFRPIYIKTDKDGNPQGSSGRYAVDETLSVPISEEQLGVALGKKNVTGKARAKEIGSVLGKTPTKTTTKPKSDPLGLF